MRRHAPPGRSARPCARALAPSRRERDVLGQVVTGALNKQIAGVLGIAEGTVKVHRGRVMEKLGAQSVADLVRLWDLADESDPRKP